MILKKSKSHFYYKWVYNEKEEWWNLNRIKCNTDAIEETLVICDQDKKTWEAYLITKGFEEIVPTKKREPRKKI